MSLLLRYSGVYQRNMPQRKIQSGRQSCYNVVNVNFQKSGVLLLNSFNVKSDKGESIQYI